MDSSQRPFQPRELLHHLPELLEGAEPEVLKPAARQMLVNDPASRAAVASVAMLVRASGGGHEPGPALRQRVVPSIRKSTERASRSFVGVMNEMLGSIGLAILSDATRHETYFNGLVESKPIPYGEEDFANAQSELRRSLGLSNESWTHSLLDSIASMVVSNSQIAKLTHASKLLEAAERLIPGNPSIEFYRIQAQTYLDPQAAKQQWRSYSRSGTTPEVVGRGMHEVARVLLTIGDPCSALKLIRRASEHLPSSLVVPFNGIQAALKTNDIKAALFMGETFHRRAQSNPPHVPGYQIAIEFEAREWQGISKSSGRSLQKILRVLPTPVSQLIESVIS